MFNSDDGLGYLADRRLVPQAVLATLRHFGLSSICNVLAAITTAKLLGLGPDDAIITVATDGAAMYPSERDEDHRPATSAAGSRTSTRPPSGASTSPTCRPPTRSSCTEHDRNRIFNLGYYTWVEQQGTPFELFERAGQQSFWRGLRRYLGVWDEMIADFNARTAA